MFKVLTRVASIVITALFLMADSAFAQTNNVGVGTTTPEPSAILDVANPYNPILGTRPKGMLVPTLNQLQRNLMESAYNDTLANGLLIYESDSGNFWYYKYDIPTPATAPYGDWVKLRTSSSNANSGMPSRGIIMWSGTIADIPAGWALCNGLLGTPDLTDKFIISVASAAENPGTAPVSGYFVDIEAGSTVFPDRRFFKLAYIMKL